jgi:hypothetical protein
MITPCPTLAGPTKGAHLTPAEVSRARGQPVVCASSRARPEQPASASRFSMPITYAGLSAAPCLSATRPFGLLVWRDELDASVTAISHEWRPLTGASPQLDPLRHPMSRRRRAIGWKPMTLRRYRRSNPGSCEDSRGARARGPPTSRLRGPLAASFPLSRLSTARLSTEKNGRRHDPRHMP